MSKLKNEINKVIQKVKGNHDDVYAARFYDTTQVLTILHDLLSVFDDEDTTGNGFHFTREMLDDLVEKIEERIEANIDNMSDTDIVDESSLEISISGTRASIDSIDINKDQITSDATYGIGDTIDEWAYDNKVIIVD